MDNVGAETFQSEEENVDHGNAVDEGCSDGGDPQVMEIDFTSLTVEDVMQMHFSDLDEAFRFYDMYAKVKGFGSRKSTTRRNKQREVIEQTFLCDCQGFRDPKHENKKNRKRKAKRVTRCGCLAKIVVRSDAEIGCFYVKEFLDDHNHKVLSYKYVGKLAKHRQMQELDIVQMNSMREAGIGISQIYGAFAKQSGGFQQIGFKLKDMYNQVDRQRRLQACDAHRVIGCLREMRSADPGMFWNHTVDGDGRLLNLFWCDGTSRMDYIVFGDVLAFDATYKRNKYMCPLVVFCGVNHHKQSVIFACAVVGNETEDTYVWVLEQFLRAMNGKTPVSVITDGDIAMKNAIARVFPNARHRLCSWHLLYNAGKNVNNKEFPKRLKKFMFADLDVVDFEQQWQELIAEFRLEGHGWLSDLYERRKLWATAYMRGSFFAGFRTTSRCESLNNMFKKYLHWRLDLTEFLVHFDRCLIYIRSNEFNADFESSRGLPALQTELRSIEKSAAKVYTDSIFDMFCDVIRKTSRYKVVCDYETPSCTIYTVRKFCNRAKEWNVSYHRVSCTLKCSCQKMEGFGIPCEHIVTVMVYVDIDELPPSLVLNRWTKSAKAITQGSPDVFANFSMPLQMCRLANIWGLCREFTMLICEDDDDYNDGKEKLINEIQMLREKKKVTNNGSRPFSDFSLKNPNKVQYKGCGGSSSSGVKGSRKHRCSVCRLEGHNKSSCPTKNFWQQDGISMTSDSGEADDFELESDTTYVTEDSEDDYDVHVNLSDDSDSRPSRCSSVISEDTD